MLVKCLRELEHFNVGSVENRSNPDVVWSNDDAAQHSCTGCKVV